MDDHLSLSVVASIVRNSSNVVAVVKLGYAMVVDLGSFTSTNYSLLVEDGQNDAKNDDCSGNTDSQDNG